MDLYIYQLFTINFCWWMFVYFANEKQNGGLELNLRKEERNEVKGLSICGSMSTIERGQKDDLPSRSRIMLCHINNSPTTSNRILKILWFLG